MESSLSARKPKLSLTVASLGALAALAALEGSLLPSGLVFGCPFGLLSRVFFGVRLVPVGPGTTLVFRVVLLGEAASVRKMLEGVVAALLRGLGFELFELGLKGLNLSVLLFVGLVDLLTDYVAKDRAVSLALVLDYLCYLGGSLVELLGENGLVDAQLFVPHADGALERVDCVKDAHLEPVRVLSRRKRNGFRLCRHVEESSTGPDWSPLRPP